MGVLAGRYRWTGSYPDGSRAQHWDEKMGQARIIQRGIEVGEAVSKMAEERGLTASQLSLLWIKDQPGVTAWYRGG